AWAMPRRTMRSVGRPSMRCPSSVICPARGTSSPMMVRSVVVLPAPLLPINVTTSPRSTVNEMPRRARILPYALCTVCRASKVERSPCAQIGFDHLRITLDVTRRTLRQLGPVIEHCDPVGNAHDYLHMMLDQ